MLWRSVLFAAALGAFSCAPGPRIEAPMSFGVPPVSVLDIPQLQAADYVAMIQRGEGLSPDVTFFAERGIYQCKIGRVEKDLTGIEDPKCPSRIVRALRGGQSRPLVIADVSGSTTTVDTSALLPIDSPQKALLFVFMNGLSIHWYDAQGPLVGSPTAGFARSVPGGFEVLGGMSETKYDPHEPACGVDQSDLVDETELQYQARWTVDRAGTITLRSRRLLERETQRVSTQAHCHPPY